MAPKLPPTVTGRFVAEPAHKRLTMTPTVYVEAVAGIPAAHLDRWAGYCNVARARGETDAQLRQRLAADYASKY
jgi:hypothetical protein